jgi:tetratricopeptide (TPR) repeat protein
MNKIIFILTFFISSVSLSAGTTLDSSTNVDNSDQIKILYKKAEKYIEEDSFKKSLKVLKALTKREDLAGFRADIYNLLGFSYRKLSKPDLDKSFAAYMMAIELDPEHIGAHEYLGELYLMLKDKSKALEMLVRLGDIAGKSTKEYLDLEEAINNFN